MKRPSAAVLFLSVLLITGVLFAQTQGVKPKSVLPAPVEKSFKEPTPEEMARDNKIKPIDKDEKDCDAGKGERFDIGVILYANWHEKADYVNNDPSADGPGYTQWNYNCQYISRFTTRVYVIRNILPPPRVDVAEASFAIYPKSITGSYVLKDAHNRVTADGVNIGPGPSGVSGGADMSMDPNETKFHLDITLTSLLMPTCSGVPMVTITPFMATLEPDVAMEIASLNPSQQLVQSPLFTEKFNRAFFKAPIRIEDLSINRLKIGPITRTMTDAKGGKGLIGKMPYTTGSMNCSYDITATVYLKRAHQEGDYDPRQPGEAKPSDGWYGAEGPKGGDGEGGPGNVKDPKPTEPQTPATSSGKGKAPGLTGNPPETDRVKDVKAKARRMLDRALRDLNMNKNSSNFSGKDYTVLNDSMREKLIGLFIRAGQAEWVTISKSPEYYSGKMAAFYNSHRNLEEQAFLDVLLTMIIMEYDWTEEGMDKEALAREYLGDSVYKANKFRSSRLM